MKSNKSLPVAIIGAGPVGLAAAAHLAIRNQPFILFEKGDTIGSSLLSWRHLSVFSPWKYNIDKAAAQLLTSTTWIAPNDKGLPTGEELISNYLTPLSELESIRPFVHLNSAVISIGRKGIDKMKTSGRNKQPYLIQTIKGGEYEQYEAKAVIDASGTWGSPNPIGSGGVYVVGEIEHAKKIFYGIPDIQRAHAGRYGNKKVLVVGSGHSSINAILELEKLKQQFPDTEIHWALRKQNIKEVYGGGTSDALEARGALGIKIEQLITDELINIYTPFQIQELREEDQQLTVIGSQHDGKVALRGIDEIIVNTGSRPDFSFLREVRLNIDPSLESVSQIAELIDPNIHSCGTVRPHGERELRHPDENFYIVGSKSYGRAPTFLMATGYEQVRSIVAFIAGDLEAAQRVELDLPETGVCNSDPVENNCCGSNTSTKEASKKVSSCCG